MEDTYNLLGHTLRKALGGRKSRSHRVDRYKRCVLRDLDAALVRAVGVTLANAHIGR